MNLNQNLNMIMELVICMDKRSIKTFRCNFFLKHKNKIKRLSNIIFEKKQQNAPNFLDRILPKLLLIPRKNLIMRLISTTQSKFGQDNQITKFKKRTNSTSPIMQNKSKNNLPNNLLVD